VVVDAAALTADWPPATASTLYQYVVPRPLTLLSVYETVARPFTVPTLLYDPVLVVPRRIT
jgi:hypothetical protein